MKILNTKAKEDGYVSLSKERWNHILGKHPEMSGHLRTLKNILTDPDIVIEGPTDSSVWLYHKNKKKVFMVVVAHITKRFIITAYTTNKVKKGEIK